MAILMIGKLENHITCFAEDKVLNIDKKDIGQYLSEVKEAVENGREDSFSVYQV